MPKTIAKTTFLNVDLDVYARSNLEPLAAAFGKRVLRLLVARNGGRYEAHFELAGGNPANAGAAIRGFARLIQRLPASGRKLWDGAARRDFNIGVQAAAEPFAFELALERSAVEAAALVGARIVFTVYAPEDAPKTV